MKYQCGRKSDVAFNLFHIERVKYYRFVSLLDTFNLTFKNFPPRDFF